jgi:hypothetical protein
VKENFLYRCMHACIKFSSIDACMLAYLSDYKSLNDLGLIFILVLMPAM